MWYLLLIPLIILGFTIFFWINSFTRQFKAQGGSASKLSEQEIEHWKNRGLNGKEAAQAYNNGWTNPAKVINGEIRTYTNYSQTDNHLNPVKVNKFELDKCYKLLFDISQDKNSDLDYTNQVNELEYYKLPLWRQRSDLLTAQYERKYDLILQNIQQAQTLPKVNKESSNINKLSDHYLPAEKRKSDLLKAKENKLKDFLNEEQRKVYNLAIQKKNVFFTGSAGTGKSFLLQRIICSLENLWGKEKVAITATTGIAAINIGGITLHYFSGIGFASEATAEELVSKILKQKSGNWVRNWNTIKTLIIDEVSMLDGKLFDKLEYIARKIRKNN